MEQPGNTEHHENSSGRPCGQRYRQGTVKTERLHQLDAEIEEEADCDAPRQHEPDAAAAGQTQAETGRNQQHGAEQNWQGQQTVEMQPVAHRSEEHTSELQSLMRTSYAVFCLQTKT